MAATRIVVDVDDDIKDAFKAEVLKDKVSMTEVVNTLVREWLKSRGRL